MLVSLAELCEVVCIGVVFSGVNGIVVVCWNVSVLLVKWCVGLVEGCSLGRLIVHLATPIFTLSIKVLKTFVLSEYYYSFSGLGDMPKSKLQ